jgi:hypothetical protein
MMKPAYELTTTGHPNCRRPDKLIDAGQFYWFLRNTRSNHVNGKDVIRLIDSTIIDLCKKHDEICERGIRFITRMESNAEFSTFKTLGGKQ